MDYAFSPIQTINIHQRIIEPIKIKKELKSKRIIKSDFNDEKITRIKQKFINLINETKLNYYHK
jgi:hypothetical protein